MAKWTLQIWLRLGILKWGDHPGLWSGPNLVKWALESWELFWPEAERCHSRRRGEIRCMRGSPLTAAGFEDEGRGPRAKQGGCRWKLEEPLADSHQESADCSPTIEWNWILPTTWIGKERFFPRVSGKQHSPSDSLTLICKIHVRLLTLRTVRWYICVFLSHFME